MDMKRIQANIESNDYPDKESLRKDIMKMFQNCMYYNQVDSPYYKAAVDCKTFITPYLDSLKDKKDLRQEQRQRQTAKKTAGKGAKTASKSASKKKPQKKP